MIQTFTPTDLILYLYNETGMSDSVCIQRSIDNDPEVEMEFEAIKNAASIVDKALVSASEASIQAILQYSRKVQPVA